MHLVQILNISEKITFCAIKSLIFNASCSNIEYISLRMGHIFLPGLKILPSRIKSPLFNYDIKSKPFLPIYQF